MRLSKAVLIPIVMSCVVLAVLTVFALDLSSNQNRSRHDIETQIHDRAVLGGALIDSLFNTAVQASSNPVYSQPVVTDADLAEATSSGNNVYLLDSSGQVMAVTPGTESSVAQSLPTSEAVQLVRSGRPYGLGDLKQTTKGQVINFASAVQTPYGQRIVVSGLPSGTGPSTLGGFLSSDLRSIPGVRGENNYVVDGNGEVLASTAARYPVGTRLAQPGAVQALQGDNPDQHGVYYALQPLQNSSWRMVLAAPDGPLFASVSGSRQLVPWLIFAAFAAVAVVALLLGWHVLRSAGRLEDANDELARVNRDLTSANSALERRAAELARSNEELDQFASIASHDLQEPLRKVRTFTEQLSVMEGDQLSDKGREYLTRANAAAERMQRLIEDLLRFSRVSTQGRPFAPVDLNETVRAVVDDLERQIADAGALVRVGHLPTVGGDATQMQQLFQNLISNAIKFRREGTPPEITIEGTIDDGNAVLQVKDNGIGFEPRYAQRIFRIFERLHGRNEYPGTGIGLALCRKIVDRHGGTIRADSDPDSGAIFTVTLPARQQATPAPEGVPSPAGAGNGATGRLGRTHADA